MIKKSTKKKAHHLHFSTVFNLKFSTITSRSIIALDISNKEPR